jgi:hypothetical protein
VKPVFVARVAALVAVAGIAFACSDRSEISAPESNPGAPSITGTNDFIVTCSANVAARTVKCGDTGNGLRGDLIVGGQGTYMQLTSSNVHIIGSDTIAFDVDVQNLMGQAIGTTDSSHTADPTGTRVFFVTGPTSTGAGVILVANPDGISSFTGANQPYFRYFGVYGSQENTGTRTWKLRFTPEVANFVFTVGVSAPVQYPHGYIDGLARVITLNPSESIKLPAVVHSALGTVQNGQTVSWSSSNTTAATVVDSTVTAGTSGFSVLKAVSNTRPGVNDVYVHTCQSMTLANGASHVDSITDSDCFTAFHPSDDSHPDEGYLPGTTWRGDLYRVSLTAGQTVDFTVDTGGSGGLDTILVLADRLGNIIDTNDDDPTLAPGSALSYTATATGVYVFQVTTYQPEFRGNYTAAVNIH